MSVESFNKIYFIGIGGVSMSGLAQVLKSMGMTVSGSDRTEGAMTRELMDKGIEVFIGHDANNLPTDCDLVVITAAITEDNVELKKAEELGLPVWRRSQLIGYLMRNRIGIAVSGTHGKSTTSAMIAEILEKAEEDPTILVGATVKGINSTSKFGQSDLLLAEACEFNRSFLDFEPTIAVITNIEEEHLDTYSDLKSIITAFSAFAGKIPKDDGLLVGNTDDVNVLKVLNDCATNKIGYGFNERPKNFTGVYWQIVEYQWKDGIAKFKLTIDDELQSEEYELNIPGQHNVYNAVAAIIVCDFLVIESEIIKQGLIDFEGAGNRFDRIGEKDGVLVISDYGHHPTEVKASIAGINQFYPDQELWVLFWPHQYNRTEQFFDDFAKSFNNVDQVVVMDIYEAREVDTDKQKVNSEALVEAIKQSGVKAEYASDIKGAVDFVKKSIKTGAILLVQGAGPTDKFIDLYMK